jgi:hypothetical protein
LELNTSAPLEMLAPLDKKEIMEEQKEQSEDQIEEET